MLRLLFYRVGWQLGDIGVGLTAWINVIALLVLCPEAIRLLRDYEAGSEK